MELVATLCAGVFAGAALLISVAEHPARLKVDPAAALADFRAWFPRARVLQVSTSVLGAVAAALAWWWSAEIAWLVTAVLMAAIPLFSLAVMVPVYDRLLDPSLAAESPEVGPLLRRWGRLHAVRTVLGVLAFGVAAGVGLR